MLHILTYWLCFRPWYKKLGHRSAPLLCSHGEAQISTRTKWSPRYKKLGSFPMASLPLPESKQCSLIFSFLWPLLLQLPFVLSKMDSKLLSRDYALVRKTVLQHPTAHLLQPTGLLARSRQQTTTTRSAPPLVTLLLPLATMLAAGHLPLLS